MAEDIDRFIQEQKSKLARERNDLQQETTRKVGFTLNSWLSLFD